MRIIRQDDGAASAQTLALAISWGLPGTCCVKDCDKCISTIIVDTDNYTLCEEHYQQGNVPGGTTLTIVLP